MSVVLKAALVLTGAAALKSAKPEPTDCKKFDWLKDKVDLDKTNQFASRPKQDIWKARMNQITDKARADPCNADIITTSYARYFGFGSRMNSFALEVLEAMYGGYSLALCNSSSDHFVERVWGPHFDNPFNLPVCSQKGKCGVCSEWDALHIGDQLSSGLSAVDPEYTADIKRFVYPYIFSVNQATMTKIQGVLSDAGLTPGEPYLGVHVRHGDKIAKREASYVAAQEYAKEASGYVDFHRSKAKAMRFIRDALAQHQHIKLVYVASDDAEAASAIQQELGPKVKVVGQPELSEKSYADRGYGKAENTVALLTDVVALRDAKVFIGTSSSNIGRLVYFLRGKDSPSISMDENGNWQARAM